MSEAPATPDDARPPHPLYQFAAKVLTLRTDGEKLNALQSAQLDEALCLLAIEMRKAAERDEPVFHLRNFGDVTPRQLEEYMANGKITAASNPASDAGAEPSSQTVRPDGQEIRSPAGRTRDGV